MAQRLKGQEVNVIIVRGGVVEDTLTDILSMNVAFQSETKIQGYLGEKNNRTDDIFNQVKFDLELHVKTAAFLSFAKAVHDRQKRKTPDVQINITLTLEFPNGDTPSILLPDCKFGEIPLNIGSRSDYVKIKLDGVCDDATFQDVLS